MTLFRANKANHYPRSVILFESASFIFLELSFFVSQLKFTFKYQLVYIKPCGCSTGQT